MSREKCVICIKCHMSQIEMIQITLRYVNTIQTLIYRKYQRRIHHACIILHTPRYLITYSNQTIKMKCLTIVEMFMYSQMFIVKCKSCQRIQLVYTVQWLQTVHIIEGLRRFT